VNGLHCGILIGQDVSFHFCAAVSGHKSNTGCERGEGSKVPR
jgi:hypothetical protein